MIWFVIHTGARSVPLPDVTTYKNKYKKFKWFVCVIAAPEVPAPEVSAPEVPAPKVPAPEVPVPEVPAPEVPAPVVPAPEVPAPEVPAPEVPAPEVPVPQVPAEVTKESIRKTVWDYLESNNLANFPRPVHNRIPNFKVSNIPLLFRG